MPNQNVFETNEDLYTLVDEKGLPIYTGSGMDGHFSHCSSFACMETFTKKIGWSHMMDLCRRSHKWAEGSPNRIKAYPAKVTISFEKIEIEP